MARTQRCTQSYAESLERYYWELKAQGALRAGAAVGTYERELASLFANPRTDGDTKLEELARRICH